MICTRCHGRGLVPSAFMGGDDCLVCDGKGKVMDFAAVMLVLKNETTIPTPSSPTNREALRFTLDEARRRVRDVKRAMNAHPSIKFAKPNSIVRVYLK